MFRNAVTSRLTTFEKLLSLASEGATIIFERTLPRDVSGFADLEKRRARFLELKNSLHPEPISNEAVPTLFEAKQGKGRILIGNLDQAIAKAGVEREAMVDHDGLLFIRTKNDEPRRLLHRQSG